MPRSNKRHQRREENDDDDILIPWTDEPAEKPITEGDYEAVIVSVKLRTKFSDGTVIAEFVFRIVTEGEFFDVRLMGYCTLGHSGRVRPRSKFASWQRAISDFTGERPNRLTLHAFRRFWFRVRVQTSTEGLVSASGRQRKPLHQRDWTSKVTDILSVVGKLSELPPERLKERRS